MRLIITGGAGFIGNALVHALVKGGVAEVTVIDKLTYASCPKSLVPLHERPAFRLVEADICDSMAIRSLFAETNPDAIVHLAAETHVDRSIDGPSDFITTNVVGTSILLNEVLTYWQKLGEEAKSRFRFLHVSTDEVYGAAEPEAVFFEGDRYNPSSPYAASKASADHLVLAWQRTYGLPVLVSLSSNNYGPWQFPEELIPLSLVRELRRQPSGICGDGLQERDWLHVDDHVYGLIAVLQRGSVGVPYHLGTGQCMSNLTLIRRLLAILAELRPLTNANYQTLITHVEDRPGHDRRYALDCGRSRQELGWTPKIALDDGLNRTVRWFLENEDWWQEILDARYDGSRLGLMVVGSQ